MFVRGTTTEQWEFPEIAGRNAKANISQKRGARFEAAVDLSKEKKGQDNVSPYERNEYLIFSTQQYMYKEHEGKA
jgi:hypothetical protein